MDESLRGQVAFNIIHYLVTFFVQSGVFSLENIKFLSRVRKKYKTKLKNKNKSKKCLVNII